MRIRLVIKYDGTDYAGWQVQANGPSVQAALEAELFKLTGEHMRVHGSGRTDSGVHARAQVAHFDTQSRIPPDKFAYALNAGLPPDIRIAYSDHAEGFHARFDVSAKHYRYAIINSQHGDPFARRYALHVHRPLDLSRMREAAAYVLGEHDFAAFKSAGVEQASTVRTVFRSEWTQCGSMLFYDVSGSGFMYNMVRILVGSMMEAGLSRAEPDMLRRAVESGDRALSGPTAPAHGLTLYRVQYPDFDTEDVL